MSTQVKSDVQETKQKGFLARLSLRNKIILSVFVVFVLWVLVTIPNSRSQLISHQEKVIASQTAYDLALPAVSPVMENIINYLDESGVDLSDNRLYTGLPGLQTRFTNTNSSTSSRFQAVVSFHKNVHSLLEGSSAVEELDTEAFRELVVEMDTTLSVSWLALMEMNASIDDYNSYNRWINVWIANKFFSSVPSSYTDPIASSSRLNDSTQLELEQ